MSALLNHPLPTVPGYTLTEALHVGKCTAIYRALTVGKNHGQPVVLKLLRSHDPSFNELASFRNQYIVTKDLPILSIVKPLTLEPWNHSYVLVMEDVGGIALQEYVQTRGRLSIEQVMVIALQLVDSLHHLSRHRILHKNINPTNILIHPDTHQIWLTDFSLASLLPKESQELQSPRSLEGTLAYIAPEQTGRMNRGIDYRADFYGLGVTLYELLTGELPFQNDDPMELIHCHMAKVPISPCELVSSIPPSLSDIVLKLMAKNAEDRYQSSLGLTHDLERCLSQWKTSKQVESFELGQEDRSDRFLIPEKIYGREAEIQTLLDAFERVSQGTSEMMLVTGFSGIGKTAVVNEIHRPITRQKGYFIKGKFDQFNRIPFSAFIQAFRGLMGQLLGESDAVLTDWKNKILATVEDNGQVLIEVIPELEKIIGPQPVIPELSGTAAQNRFNLLFSKFIQLFTLPEHPLVIFLDDLQWADPASLNLLKLLIDKAENGYLLILGAYRDNEIWLNHPLVLTLDELKQKTATLHTLTLEPLSQRHIYQLVADTLLCDADVASPLAELVYPKTQGNPFFTNQFLQELHSNGYISFDETNGVWQCNLLQVGQLTITNNVVEFMVGRLRQLPTATQEALKLSACIGNHFDLQTLAVVCECSQVEAAANLWPLLQMGLVVPASNAYKFLQADLENIEPTDARTDGTKVSYRFLHDCVQKSAYALISQDQKKQIHYHLGKLLTREISAASQETRIFELVTHLNHGSDYINVQNFRDDVAQLNLKACQKAKRAIAYQAGYEYAAMGLVWLGAEGWERQYDLSLQLYNFAAEFAWLCGDLETMDSHIQTILQQSQSLLDKIPAFCLRIQADTSQMQFADALAVAQHVLKLLGVSLPSSATLENVLVMVADIEQILSETSIADLTNLPVMEKQSDVAVIQIIGQVIPAAYICGSPLFPIVVTSGVKLLVRSGNSPLSAYIYANYAYILCNYCQAIETGEEFGQLALKLAHEPDAKLVRPQVYVMLALYMQHRKSPLRETLNLAQQGYIFAQEVGNQEWAGYSAYAFCANGFASTQNLSDLCKMTQDYCVSLVELSQIAPANWCQIYRQAILTLTNPAPQQQQIFFNNSDQEANFLEGLHQAEDLLGLYHFHLCKLIISYLFGNIKVAHYHALEARARIDVAKGTVGLPVFYFYDSLVLLSQSIKTNLDSEERAKKLQQVESNQEKLQQNWANYAPVNYQHKFNLVQAEKLGVLGEQWAALELYDATIAEAKAHGYIQEEALANELAAKFYLDWGKQKIAAVYMQDAYHCYDRWGARAKTDDLEQHYPQLLQPILSKVQGSNPLEALARVANPNLSSHPLSSSSPATSTNSNTDLDFSTVLKSAQLLSEKIQLDELLTQLVKLMLQSSGADKLAIVLPEEDGLWQVRATATLEKIELLTEPLTQHLNLPIQLIQYVKNTQEVIVIDDRNTQLPIIDTYLQQHQPHSVLCLPLLHKGDLSGLLYLQHQSVSGIFNRDRILVLNFLCSQAAIALENARLFKEQKQSAIDLQIKNSFLKAQQESSLDGMLVIDRNRQVIAYNQRFVSIWNIPDTVLETRDDRQLLDYVLDQLENPTNFLERVEYLYDHPEESSHDEINLEDQRVLERYSSPVRLPSGEYNSRIWYFRDISDRKTVEQELVLKQNHLEALLNNIPHIAWVKDSESRFIAVNEPLAQMLNSSPAEMFGKTDYDFSPAEIARGYQEDDFQVLASGQRKVVEERTRRGDGSWGWLETTKTPFRNAQGQLAGTVGIAVDISDRKQAERLLTDYNQELERQVEERTGELQESEERLRLALSATNQGFFDLNLQTGETITSPEYALMLGYDPAIFHETDETWQSRLHPDDREQIHQAYRDYESGKTSQYEVEFRLQTRQGDWKWILSMGKFIEWDEAGKPTRLLGTHTDISDRKFAELQLAAQNELLARIAQGQPLSEVLNALIQHVEQSLDEVLCAVLLLDKDNRLRHGAAPNLPAAYSQAANGVLIGEGVGSCGTAAFRNQTVIVADIATDPLWSDYKDLALGHGLRAAWSTPITARGGQVLGTFAMYYKQVRAPQPQELKVIEQMAHIAGIAIERDQAEANLRQSEATLLKAQQVAHVGNWEFDIVNQTITWSPEMFRIYGLAPTDAVPSYSHYLQMLPAEARLRVQQAIEQTITKGTPYTIEYSWLKADRSIRHHECRAEAEQDEQGQVIRLFGTTLDITERKQAELALQNLVTGTAATIGQDFFPALVQHISAALEVPIALVTQFVGQELQSLAFIVDGELQPNFTYNLPDTPCRDLVVDYTYHCPSNLSEHFPNHPHRTRGVDSYLGVALRDRQGQVLGSLCIFDRQPLQEFERAKQILKVFGSRAAAELERQRTEKALENLIAGTAVTTRADFFPFLVRYLTEALGVSHALMAERVGEEEVVLAYFGDGKLLPTQSFSFLKTPCEEVYQRGAYYCELDPCQTTCSELNKMEARSYLGVALNDRQGNAIGLLSIFHRQILPDPMHAEQILQVFAARAATELERQRAENALQNLIAGTAAFTGPDFFHALVRHIAEALNVSCVIVNEVIDSAHVRILAAWADGEELPNETIELTGTPCEIVLQEETYYCDRNLVNRFPKSSRLAEMGLESYQGIVLRDYQGRIIGMLCIFARQPLVDPERSKQLLQVFAARAAAELERQRAENALQNLIEGTAALTGPDFFPALAHHIAEALQASHAFVTEVVDGGSRLNFLAAWADGEHLPNDTVDIEGTTCAVALREGAYHCERDVIACFPQNPRLAPMGVESYMGVALKNRQGQSLGTLCIFSRQLIVNPEHSQEILQVFAARAAAELERQRAEQAMEQLNHELEIRVQDRTAQLAASEDRLKTLFNQAADAVFLLGEQEFIDCNQAAVDLLRYPSKTELLSLQPHQISPERQPDDQLSVVKAQSMIHEALKRNSFRFEWIHQRADEEIFWAEITLTPIRYQEEIIFHCITRDISDRKQLEQEQSRLTAVLEATPDFIGIANAQGEILWHNKPLRELRQDLGNSGDHRSIAACHPAWVNNIIYDEALPTAIRQGSWSGELALLDGKGNEIPVSQVIIAHKSASGDVESFSTIMRDIRDRKHAERVLKSSEARATAGFEQASVGIVEGSFIDGKITRINNCFCHMTGYTNEELTSLTIDDLTHPEDLSEFQHKIQQLYLGGIDSFTFEKRCIPKDKSYFWVNTTISLIQNPEEASPHWFAVVQDISDRKDAEEALRLSKARAQSTFDQAAVGFVEVDIKTKKCVRVNNCFCDMLGYTTAELIKMTVGEITHPDDIPASLEAMRQLHNGEIDNFNLEKRYIRKDGSIFWAETTCYMIKPQGGEAIYSVALIQNISEKKRLETERQRAALALQLSEARANAAFEQAAVGIAESNLTDGKITRTNNYFCQMTGYTAQELESMTAADLTYPDDISDSRDKIKQLYTGKIDSFTIEKRYLRKDGSNFWATTAVTLIQNPVEDSPRCLAVVQDIRDRKAAELALQDSQTRFQRMTENVPGMIHRYIVHADGSDELTYVDSQVREIFEVEPEAALQNVNTLWERIHPDDISNVKTRVRASAETLEPLTSEHRLLLPQKGLRWVQIFSRPERLDNGDVFWDGVAIDISDRKQAEEQIRQTLAQLETSNNELESFAYSISHDLRAPLRAINGFSQALCEDYGDLFDEEGQDYLDRIRANTNRMGQLIDDLLQLSRLSRSELRYTMVDLSSLAQEILGNLQKTDPNRQVDVTITSEITVFADTALMQIVLMNLLENAWKFTSRQPTAHIEFGILPPKSQASSAPIYFVKDDGAGFDMTYGHKLFGVFQRLHSINEFPGTGIGLASVQRAIHRHGGQVWADATVGEGATFFFTVPTAAFPTSPTSINAVTDLGDTPIE